MPEACAWAVVPVAERRTRLGYLYRSHPASRTRRAPGRSRPAGKSLKKIAGWWRLSSGDSVRASTPAPFPPGMSRDSPRFMRGSAPGGRMGAHRRAQPDSGRVTPAASRRRQGEDEALLQRDHAILAAWSLGCQPAVAPAARTADARPARCPRCRRGRSASAVGGVRSSPPRSGDASSQVERLRVPTTRVPKCCARRWMDSAPTSVGSSLRSARPERCDRAGRFAEDCRMHAWTAGCPSWPDRPTRRRCGPKRSLVQRPRWGFRRATSGRGWQRPGSCSGGSCRSTGRSVMGGRRNDAKSVGEAGSVFFTTA